MISSRIYDNDVHLAYMVLWYMYLFLVSMLGVIIVVIIIQKGSKKRKRNLTGQNLSKEMLKII